MKKLGASSLLLPEWKEVMSGYGQPSYRAAQLFRWIHARGAESFSGMTDLPAGLADRLESEYRIEMPGIRTRQESKDGTVKYLYSLDDGNCIESVVMRYVYGYSECISSEVGCRMGCRFCASTQKGLVRPLTAGEMVSQIYRAEKDLGVRISHVDLMGIGEPLDNYENVLRFIRLITSPDGKKISMRSISLSTCGLVPMIGRLAEEKLGITLSVSLHAPNDRIRSSMMPVNDAWPLSKLIPACRAYQQSTGRRISFEYAMVRGVNDTPSCADQLAELIRGMDAHVNLIPVNPVDGSPFSASDAAGVRHFQERLSALGVNATVRRRLGSDISAACGQLRREEMG